LRIDTEQKAKIERLLAQNEEALGRFDAAIAAIGDMKTGAEGATMDMESAMSELARIAKRARGLLLRSRYGDETTQVEKAKSGELESVLGWLQAPGASVPGARRPGDRRARPRRSSAT
jgi:hypothetical protein